MNHTYTKWFLGLAVALAAGNGLPVLAQDAPPPPPPQQGQQAPAPSTGGWRKFGDGGSNSGFGTRPMNPANNDDQNQAPPQGQPMPVPPPQLLLPAGTWLTVRVNQPLSSDHNQPGDAFTATLMQPLVANGWVVARRGQTIQGRVTEAVKAGRVSGVSRLGVELTMLGLVDGQQVAIKTQATERKGDTSVGHDVGAVGVTAGTGAAIGAAAAGGLGAGLGAIAGAGAATIGVFSTRGKPTVIYPEMALTFHLDNPVTISTERSQQAFEPVSRDDYERNTQLRQGPPQPRPAGSYYGPAYGPGYYPYYGGVYAYPWYGPSFYVGPRFYYGGRGFYRRY
jgi:hypothetical protein